jgi:hypothetical protein
MLARTVACDEAVGVSGFVLKDAVTVLLAYMFVTASDFTLTLRVPPLMSRGVLVAAREREGVASVAAVLSVTPHEAVNSLRCCW